MYIIYNNILDTKRMIGIGSCEQKPRLALQI
jgi:hypothetical protein